MCPVLGESVVRVSEQNEETGINGAGDTAGEPAGMTLGMVALGSL